MLALPFSISLLARRLDHCRDWRRARPLGTSVSPRKARGGRPKQDHDDCPIPIHANGAAPARRCPFICSLLGAYSCPSRHSPGPSPDVTPIRARAFW